MQSFFIFILGLIVTSFNACTIVCIDGEGENSAEMFEAASGHGIPNFQPRVWEYIQTLCPCCLPSMCWSWAHTHARLWRASAFIGPICEGLVWRCKRCRCYWSAAQKSWWQFLPYKRSWDGHLLEQYEKGVTFPKSFEAAIRHASLVCFFFSEIRLLCCFVVIRFACAFMRALRFSVSCVGL